MPRPPRIQYPDAHYHVCARGNERRRIFWNDGDFLHFCDLMGQMSGKFDIAIYAFVLMSNHIHLMATTPLSNISRGMHWLKTSYSVWVNRKRSRTGHLFQGRYYSVLIEDESHYLELSRYIHLNPVRAGMTKLPEDYTWSSCRDYLNRKQRWPWLIRDEILNELGGKGRDRYRHYRDFLHAGIGLDESELKQFRVGTILGGEKFRDWISKEFGDDKENTSKGKIFVRKERLPINGARRCLEKKISGFLPRLAGHRGTMMYLLQRLGYKLQEIGDEFGVSYSAVSQNTRRYVVDNAEKNAFDAIMSNVKV